MRQPNTELIHRLFKKRVRKSWSFEGTRSVNNLTHGYHRYPAKFLPELVKKLIEKYTLETHNIADVFAGCGTTLVEGKLHGRKTVGVDINPVAQLITRAKINPIKPQLLKIAFDSLQEQIVPYNAIKKYSKKKHPRIDYWFDEINKNKIAFLYSKILTIKEEKVRDFFLCALSHVLKNCSRWLQDSTKPQVDPDKTPSEVFSSFVLHSKRMIKKNEEFYKKLKDDNLLSTPCNIKLADSRRTRIRSNSINAIITSPPYVTSYEYADIHQLTAYWFDYISDISTFRRKFIGTFHSLNKKIRIPTYCPTAKDIVEKLSSVEPKCAREVSNYFTDMLAVAKEMYRISATNGVVCLVIGNTTLRNIKISSAEVFAEMLFSVGFEIEDVIKRSISSKIIPTIRDKTTGKFSTPENDNKKLVYPEEFIIIARKRG